MHIYWLWSCKIKPNRIHFTAQNCEILQCYKGSHNSSGSGSSIELSNDFSIVCTHNVNNNNNNHSSGEEKTDSPDIIAGVLYSMYFRSYVCIGWFSISFYVCQQNQYLTQHIGMGEQTSKPEIFQYARKLQNVKYSL